MQDILVTSVRFMLSFCRAFNQYLDVIHSEESNPKSFKQESLENKMNFLSMLKFSK